MAYDCPFCGVLLAGRINLEVVVRRAYESHLDEHMRRGDTIPAAEPLAPLRLAA